MKAIREMLLGVALMILGIFVGAIFQSNFWVIAAILLEIVGLVTVIDGFFVGRQDD